MNSSYFRGMERSSSILPSFSSQQQREQHISTLVRKTMCLFTRPCERLARSVMALASQPMFLYTFFWTFILALSVTVAAISLEMGFSASIASHAEHLEACTLSGNTSLSCKHCFRLPLDGPNDELCVPAFYFKKSGLDFAVPPIFAGLVVISSALFVQSLHLFDE